MEVLVGIELISVVFISQSILGSLDELLFFFRYMEVLVGIELISVVFILFGSNWALFTIFGINGLIIELTLVAESCFIKTSLLIALPCKKADFTPT